MLRHFDLLERDRNRIEHEGETDWRALPEVAVVHQQEVT